MYLDCTLFMVTELIWDAHVHLYVFSNPTLNKRKREVQMHLLNLPCHYSPLIQSAELFWEVS